MHFVSSMNFISKIISALGCVLLTQCDVCKLTPLICFDQISESLHRMLSLSADSMNSCCLRDLSAFNSDS